MSYSYRQRRKLLNRSNNIFSMSSNGFRTGLERFSLNFLPLYRASCHRYYADFFDWTPIDIPFFLFEGPFYKILQKIGLMALEMRGRQFCKRIQKITQEQEAIKGKIVLEKRGRLVESLGIVAWLVKYVLLSLLHLIDDDGHKRKAALLPSLFGKPRKKSSFLGDQYVPICKPLLRRKLCPVSCNQGRKDHFSAKSVHII